MATVGTRNLTLADVARRKDPSGKIAKIVELLSETNEMMEDMVVKEANDGTNNKTTVRTGIPSGTWRKLYGGIVSTKSETAQVIDSCGMLEALPKIDADLIDKSTDPNGALLSEHMAHIEGLSQDVSSTFWYGDTAVNPERFMGLSPRYDEYRRAAQSKLYSDYNVIHGGGSGADNASIWLVTWGDNACHGIYPQGSVAGLKSDNLGKQLTPAGDSPVTAGDYMAYITHYKWDIGITVRDWRSIGRIANIDVSVLEGGTRALISKMVELSERVRGPGRRVWYMPERIRTQLRLEILGTSNVNLVFDTVEGKKVMMFDGIPVRVSDALLLAESLLSQAS